MKQIKPIMRLIRMMNRKKKKNMIIGTFSMIMNKLISLRVSGLQELRGKV